MNLDGLAFDQHGLESLNAQTVERGRAIEQDRMLANDFFEDVPDDRFLTLNHFPRLLDGRGVLLLFQLVVDEWLEQLERHLLRQTALMQLQLGSHNDHRTAGVVDALAQQVLSKATLLTFQRSG